MSRANLKALESYQGVGLNAVVEEAKPVEIVRMLFDGFLARVSAAEAHIRSGNMGGKAQAITKAINILNGLRLSLDMDQGYELSERLDSLYEYVALRLFEANVESDLEQLGECRRLINEVRTGWIAAHALKVRHADGTTI